MYASNLLTDKYKRSLNGIKFEWTVGQITKKGFEGWFAKLAEYQKQNGTLEVLGDNKKKNPQLAKWGNYARRTSIAVLTNKKKMQSLPCNDVRCLSTLGWFLSIFYQYGSEDSDEVGAQQDSTRRHETKTTTDTTRNATQSLKATTMNMTSLSPRRQAKWTRTIL
jgi:hypothetical protein